MGDALLPRGEVWLIRHAETEWSVDGRHTGRADIPLTDDGCRSAAALAPRLAGHDFALVLCSPLQRAVQTAQLAGVGCGAVASPDLMEWDYGEFEGVTTVEIKEGRPDWDLWRDGCPGGESPDDVAARADDVIRTACEADGDVLLVSHGHLLRVLGARWIGLPAAAGARLSLGTGALCVLGQERGVRTIRAWGSE
jgi:probable phosphoglycerate mutase